MKSGRVTGRKQATNSLKVDIHCFVTQIPYKRNKNINLKHNKPKMLRFSRTFCFMMKFWLEMAQKG